MVAPDSALPPAERQFLLGLQRQALQYFLDNQVPGGLFLDRQDNHGPRRSEGMCSIAATGMGFIALALASAAPYHLLSPKVAALRLRVALRSILEWLPHDHGVMPHFIHSATHSVYGTDCLSTIESAWLVAGALWAGAFLEDSRLEWFTSQLYDRIDWSYWTGSEASGARDLVRHGKGRDGQFLRCSWDRLNGETVFMYVLGAGANTDRALSPDCLARLQPFYGRAGGLHFNNADLGLFVFQYGLDLLNLRKWHAPGIIDLAAEAPLAARANRQTCRDAADTFTTYRSYWGLSSGDGPPATHGADVYRAYSPSGPIDGTAHLTSTLASVAHEPAAVVENLRQAQHEDRLRAHGRYGFSNINVDRAWVSRDMVGIDAGAAVLALDNYLVGDRIRDVFHRVPFVRRGLERLGFVPSGDVPSDPIIDVRRAS
jgi:hypothetical protein